MNSDVAIINKENEDLYSIELKSEKEVESMRLQLSELKKQLEEKKRQIPLLENELTQSIKRTKEVEAEAEKELHLLFPGKYVFVPSTTAVSVENTFPETFLRSYKKSDKTFCFLSFPKEIVEKTSNLQNEVKWNLQEKYACNCSNDVLNTEDAMKGIRYLFQKATSIQETNITINLKLPYQEGVLFPYNYEKAEIDTVDRKKKDKTRRHSISRQQITTSMDQTDIVSSANDVSVNGNIGDTNDVSDANDVSDVSDVNDANDANDVNDANDANDTNDTNDANDTNDTNDANDAINANNSDEDDIIQLEPMIPISSTSTDNKTLFHNVLLILSKNKKKYRLIRTEFHKPIPNLSHFNVSNAIQFVISKLEKNRNDDFIWLLYLKLFLSLGIDLHEPIIIQLFNNCLHYIHNKDFFLYYFIEVLTSTNGSEIAVKTYWNQLLQEPTIHSSFLLSCCILIINTFPSILSKTDLNLIYCHLHSHHNYFINELFYIHDIITTKQLIDCPIEKHFKLLLQRFKAQTKTREDVGLLGDCKEFLKTNQRMTFYNMNCDCSCQRPNADHYYYYVIISWIEEILTLKLVDIQDCINALMKRISSICKRRNVSIYNNTNEEEEEKKQAENEYIEATFILLESVCLFRDTLNTSQFIQLYTLCYQTIDSMLKNLNQYTPYPYYYLHCIPEKALLQTLLNQFYQFSDYSLSLFVPTFIKTIQWSSLFDMDLYLLNKALNEYLSYILSSASYYDDEGTLIIMCLLHLGLELYLNGYQCFYQQLNCLMRVLNRNDLMWTYYILLIMNMNVFRFNKAYLEGLYTLIKNKQLYLKEQSIL